MGKRIKDEYVRHRNYSGDSIDKFYAPSRVCERVENLPMKDHREECFKCSFRYIIYQDGGCEKTTRLPR